MGENVPFIHLEKAFFAALCMSRNIRPASQSSSAVKQSDVRVSLLLQDPVTWTNKREATELRRLGRCQGNIQTSSLEKRILPLLVRTAHPGNNTANVFAVAMVRKVPWWTQGTTPQISPRQNSDPTKKCLLSLPNPPVPPYAAVPMHLPFGFCLLFRTPAGNQIQDHRKLIGADLYEVWWLIHLSQCFHL